MKRAKGEVGAVCLQNLLGLLRSTYTARISGSFLYIHALLGVWVGGFALCSPCPPSDAQEQAMPRKTQRPDAPKSPWRLSRRWCLPSLRHAAQASNRRAVAAQEIPTRPDARGDYGH
jgi:hypothetical protein